MLATRAKKDSSGRSCSAAHSCQHPNFGCRDLHGPIAGSPAASGLRDVCWVYTRGLGASGSGRQPAEAAVKRRKFEGRPHFALLVHIYECFHVSQ